MTDASLREFGDLMGPPISGAVGKVGIDQSGDSTSGAESQ